MRQVPSIRLALAVVAAALLVLGSASAGAATSPSAGVVVIDTALGLNGAVAAGTGMVLTPSGEILTNNHVIAGATTISIVVPQTGRTYHARVLGYDIGGDTALLKLAGASGLRTVATGSSASLGARQPIRAVGNAGGSGRLTVVSGRVTGTRRSITVVDDSGLTRRMTGLIEIDAPLEPGDSGGPLLDAAGRVVGMDTAADLGRRFVIETRSVDGYAIPIERALGVVRKIEAGAPSAAIHVGPTAFLGIQVSPTASAAGGVAVAGVVAGSPADHAGLGRGDVITALGGAAVHSRQGIVALLLRRRPGSTVRLAWRDAGGAHRSASVVLATGPPQ